MTIKVRITFKSQTTSFGVECNERDAGFEGVVEGLEVPYEHLTIGDLTDRIAETEAYLSRITGLVVKIETGAAE